MPTRSAAPDIELGKVRDGYPALARWIAQDPDKEPFVFRKFSRLGARHILHLQARLVVLEHEIDHLDEAARTSSDADARQASRRYETLIEHKDDERRKEKERIEKLEELGGLLKDYYKTLLRQAQISEFRGPSTRVLSTFRDYLDGRGFKAEGMENMPLISGRAGGFLSEEFEEDLIALRKATDEDVLSKFLQDHWAFHKRQSADPIDRTTLYKNNHVVRTVTTISMIIAAVLLISAILSLHALTSNKAKLGLVAMYTLLFALSVSLLTNARRAEVFAATAAYAAVLVVFVSGELGGSRHQCLIRLDNGYFKAVRCPEK